MTRVCSTRSIRQQLGVRQDSTAWTITNNSRSLIHFYPFIQSNYFAKALHYSLPAFAPIIPTNLLPYLTAALLIPTFALAFYFSTYVPTLISSNLSHVLYSIPKHTVPIWETAVASITSILGSFGVVALFCSVGVYV
jgi:hypothetical protein